MMEFAEGMLKEFSLNSFAEFIHVFVDNLIMFGHLCFERKGISEAVHTVYVYV